MAWWVSPDCNTARQFLPSDDLNLMQTDQWATVAGPLIVYQRAWNEGRRILLRLRDGSLILGTVQSFDQDGSIMIEDAYIMRKERGRFLPKCHHRGARIDSEQILVATIEERGSTENQGQLGTGGS